ncbi:MAG TPA: YbhB/YbcL family Raf kinase inhibitor-like protein [Kofleriaceae bacterium]|jgi:hypothetical protein
MRILVSLASLAFVACGHSDDAGGKGAADPEPTAPVTMTVTSSAFTDGAAIPAKYTCTGGDVSPPLAWSNAPPDTKSFALVVDDPDAPKKTWVHWLLTEISPRTTALLEGAGSGPPGMLTGQNDWMLQRYKGPCPPSGLHHYHFKVYALDTPGLGVAGMSKSALFSVIRGHVLARGELVGTYQK